LLQDPESGHFSGSGRPRGPGKAFQKGGRPSPPKGGDPVHPRPTPLKESAPHTNSKALFSLRAAAAGRSKSIGGRASRGEAYPGTEQKQHGVLLAIWKALNLRAKVDVRTPRVRCHSGSNHFRSQGPLPQGAAHAQLQALRAYCRPQQ